MNSTAIAIVIPVLNEAESIIECLRELRKYTTAISDISFKTIIVDDGSTDGTVNQIKSFREEQAIDDILLLSLTRNFGKEAAIHAGLSHASEYDAAIVMDGDLQHPPQLITEMIESWKEGFLVAEGVKSSRGEESTTKNFLVRTYYRLFNFFTRLNISNDTDFKLLDRTVVQAYCTLSESNRFFRGLMKWMNFPCKQIPFDVPDSPKKKTSWKSGALFRYSISSITSFSAFPLQLVTLFGGVTFAISIVIGSVTLMDKLTGKAVDGFTTVILLILIIGSVMMFSLGLIGTYIGKIYDEVKRRPGFKINKETSDDF